MIRIDHRLVQGEGVPLDPGRIPELTKMITGRPAFNGNPGVAAHLCRTRISPFSSRGNPAPAKSWWPGAVRPGASSAQDLPAPQLRRPDGVLGVQRALRARAGGLYGARYARPGKFRLAHGGSLFLDEVGDLPLAIQPRLLRAVEQGEIEPVGGDGAGRGGCTSGCRHQPGSAPAHCPGSLPPGPLRPTGSTGHPPAPFAGAADGHSVAGQPFRPGDGPALWPGAVPGVQRGGPASPCRNSPGQEMCGNSRTWSPGRCCSVMAA